MLVVHKQLKALKHCNTHCRQGRIKCKLACRQQDTGISC